MPVEWALAEGWGRTSGLVEQLTGRARRSQIQEVECPYPGGHHVMHTPRGKLSLGPHAPAAAFSPPCLDNPLSQTRSSIPVSHIRAVERVEEGAFQLPHVMQVVTQDGSGTLHTTYLQCKVRHGQDGRWGMSLESRVTPVRNLPPLPAECERPQPMAVGPAQGQRPQSRQAGLLPRGCFPQLPLDLLPAGGALR